MGRGRCQQGANGGGLGAQAGQLGPADGTGCKVRCDGCMVAGREFVIEEGAQPAFAIAGAHWGTPLPTQERACPPGAA